MPIRIVCPQGHALQVKEELAGKKIKCPKCSSVVSVTASQDLSPGFDEFASLPSQDPFPALSQAAFPQSDNFDWTQSLPEPAVAPDLKAAMPASQASATTVRKPSTSSPANQSASSGDIVTSLRSYLNNKTILAASAGIILGICLVGGVVFGLTWFSNSRSKNVVGRIPDGPGTQLPVPVVKETVGQPYLGESRGGKPPDASTESAKTKDAGTPDTQLTTPNDNSEGATHSYRMIPTPEEYLPLEMPPTEGNALKKLASDSKLDAFFWPGKCRSFAYDEKSGRLAVARETTGLLVFDIEKLLQGETEPSEILVPDQKVSALCVKALGTEQLFCFSVKDSTVIQMLNTGTLQKSRELDLSSSREFQKPNGWADDKPIYVGNNLSHLTGSLDPEDRFIYVTPEQSASIYRVPLVDEQPSQYFGMSQFRDGFCFADGKRFFFRASELSGRGSFIGSWDDFRVHESATNVDVTRYMSALGLGEPIIPSDDRVADFCFELDSIDRIGIGRFIAERVFHSGKLSYRATNRLDFLPVGYLKKVTSIIGLSDKALFFASINDYRIKQSIPLPRTIRVAIEKRYRFNPTSPVKERQWTGGPLGANLCRVFPDQQRGLLLTCLEEHLIVLPSDRVSLEEERSIVPQNIPAQIYAGTETVIDFKASAPDLNTSIIPSSSSLTDHRIQICNSRLNRNVCLLQTDIAPDDNIIEFRFSTDEPNTDLALPFFIRIDNEVMKVTNGAGNRWKVVRDPNSRCSHVATVASRNTDRDNNSPDLKTLVILVDENGNEKIDPIEMEMYGQLDASVDPRQDFLYYGSLDQSKNLRPPFKIYVGDEEMLVTRFDTLKDALHVKRSKEVAHDVTEPIMIRIKETSGPKVEQSVFKWLPGTKDLQKTNLLFRFEKDGVVATKVCPIEVAAGSTTWEIDLEVAGISGAPHEPFVCLWGNQAERSSFSVDRTLATYDTNTKKILKQTSLDGRIYAARLHNDFIYVSKEMKWNEAEGDSPEYEILKLNSQSLEKIASIPVKDAYDSLEIIKDRYLVGRSTDSFDAEDEDDSLVREALIDLISFKCTRADRYPFSIHGESTAGICIDGILWDKDLSQIQMLLFPRSILEYTGASQPDETEEHSDSETSRTIDFQANRRVPFLTLSPTSWIPTEHHYSRYRNLTFSRDSLSLYATPVDVSGNSLMMGEVSIAAFAAMPEAQPQLDKVRNAIQTSKLLPVRMQELPDRLLFVDKGKVLDIDASRFPPTTEAPFALQLNQDSLVLDGSKPVTLSYHAPGASSYQIKWALMNRAKPGNGPFSTKHSKSHTLTSNDGNFEIEFDDSLAQHAIKQANITGKNPEERKKSTSAHVKAISPAMKMLTGQNPKSIPVLLQVEVIATIENEEKVASLRHYYIVEPSIKTIQKLLQANPKGN